jgi:hypothetical protein
VRFEDLAALQDLEKAGKVALHVAGDSIRAGHAVVQPESRGKAARGRPWLQRDELRHAISAAVDRKAIVNAGVSRRSGGDRRTDHAGHKGWFLPDLRPPATDASAAASCWRRSI